MNTSVWGRFYTRPFQLAHSVDGGHTWSHPIRRRGWYDATRSVVDNTGGKFDGRLYVFSNRLANRGFANFNDFYEPLLISADGGRSLLAAKAAIPGNRYLDAGWPSQAIVLPNGKVLAAHFVQFSRKSTGSSHSPISSGSEDVEQLGIDIVSSADGGSSLKNPVTVATWQRDLRLRDGESRATGGTNELVVALGVDRSSGMHKGRVYVAWRQAERATALSHIMLSYSDDDGQTWAAAKRIDDAPAVSVPNGPSRMFRGTDPIMPSLAITGDGVVGVLWAERRDVPVWRFAASLDGAETFLPSIEIYSASSRSDAFRTQWFNNYMSVMDYPIDWSAGIVRHQDQVGFTLYTQAEDFGALVSTADNVFHAFWTTKDDGMLWTSRIHVRDEQNTKILTSLDSLKQVSQNARLEATNFHYDESSGLVFIDAQLLNTATEVPGRFPRTGESRPDFVRKVPVGQADSSESVKAKFMRPVVVRVTSMKSEIGTVELVNPDGFDANGMPLVDWSSAVPAAGLMPGTRSAVRRLAFRVANIHPSVHPDVVRVVSMSAEVFSYVGSNSALTDAFETAGRECCNTQ